MKNLIPIILMFLFGGCIGYRISHVTGNISGTNITTPYGPATGNLQYDATTCLGNCPKPMEIINESDSRSATNIAK